MGYTPYSQRHNITDPDLAGLLDYCERIMGWDIEFTYHFRGEPPVMWGIHCGPVFYIGNNGGSIHFYTGAVWKNGHNKAAFSEMPEDIFFRTYRTLLPVIRDLYSK